MPPITVTAVLSALEELLQLYPAAQSLINLINKGDAVTQADADAAVATMKQAVAQAIADL